MNRQRWVTHSPEETVALGRSIAQRLRRGDIVALIGELGSGKTQFVKGIAEAFRAHPHVSSPTFVIMNRYDGQDADGREIFLFHVDLYRIEGTDAVLDLGLEEVFDADGITRWKPPSRSAESLYSTGRSLMDAMLLQAVVYEAYPLWFSDRETWNAPIVPMNIWKFVTFGRQQRSSHLR